MADNCQGSVRCAAEDLRQALSIHTQKITDSCRDKDCIEDLRVYLTNGLRHFWILHPAQRCAAQN